ncbi:formimidoylglutamase [Peptostreptococcaceae bacterium AGR-M142]
MFSYNYSPTQKDFWQGRIDSETNYDAFRWHQWIEVKNLTDDLKPFDIKLGFGIIGFCCDEGVKRNKGRQGAKKGPFAIRNELRNLPCRFKQDVKIYDFGDIHCNDSNLEKAQDDLAYCVDRIISLNLIPLVLGGGHEVAFGNYKGIYKNLKTQNENPKIGIVNFDAHFDLRPYFEKGNSGTMFRQIADMCIENNTKYSYFCMGIQKHRNTLDLFKTADKLNAKYVLAKDIQNKNTWPIIESLDDFIKSNDHIYLTICTDVFSSAYAPGVSATQPLGINPEKALKFIKYIIRSDKLISFDIAEVSPRFDQDNTTANLASALIFSIIDTVCQIKKLNVE